VLSRYGSYANWIPLALYIGGTSLLILIALTWICFGGLHSSSTNGSHRLRGDSDRSNLGGASGGSSRSSRTNSHRNAALSGGSYGNSNGHFNGHNNGTAANGRTTTLRQPLMFPVADGK
jgi:hypothetical protein